MKRNETWLMVATMALAASGICAAEVPRCSDWELVNPRPQANHLRDVAFGGGRWIAVGEGTAVVSTDAVAWSAVTLPGLSLNGVAYGNGVFVAVGDDGAVLHSAEGEEWEVANPPVTASLAEVAFAGGQFLAVGEETTVLSSVDGLVWTQEWPAAVQGDLAGVRVSGWFAGNKGPMFMVWGPSSIALRRLDGTWLPIPLPEGAVVSQTTFWVNSAICATFACNDSYCPGDQCGPTSFRVTHDGVTWETLCHGLERGPDDVVANGRGLVAFHRYPSEVESRLWTTPDGWSWFRQASAFNVPMRAIEAAGGVFVAVGDHGALSTSTDGTAWTNVSGPTIDFERAAWNGTRFAAGGWRFVDCVDTYCPVARLQMSVVGGDAERWASDSITDLRLVAGGPGLVLAMAGWGFSPNFSYSSADAVEWTTRSVLPPGIFLSALWDGARFVVVGGGHNPWCRITNCDAGVGFAAVGDGTGEWVAVERPGLYEAWWWQSTGMAFNGTRYVALFDTEPIFASEDGLAWRQVAAAPVYPLPSWESGPLQAVAADGSRFVAVRGETVVTSPDGLAWSSHSVAPLRLLGVMWTGDEYVAVGDDGAGHAAIARSPDGVTWTSEAFPAIPARLLAVAGGRRVQLAVGTGGLTLRRECHPQTPSRRLRGSR